VLASLSDESLGLVKAKKFLRKQADKAELMARSSKDVELAQDVATWHGVTEVRPMH
jgi:hypothetical protein